MKKVKKIHKNKLLKYQAMLLKCRVELESMIAENQHRLSLNLSIAYVEDDFDYILDELKKIIEVCD